MKTRILLVMLFVASYGFSQKVNDYKAVIIPMKYDFLKSENQYRLQTITKINLQKAGFQSFYATETMPVEFNNRCDLLYLDVKKDNAFLVTKLYVTFKDCFGTVIFQSAIGKSREKEYSMAYADALNEAFMSVNALNYKYNGTLAGSKSVVLPVVAAPVANLPATTTPAVVVPAVAVNKEVNDLKTSQNYSADLLYAQPTSYGYQLIDSEPKVVMKVYKTSNPSSYMAAKGNVQGVLVAKDNQWFFEYYQGDKLISEKVNVKF